MQKAREESALEDGRLILAFLLAPTAGVFAFSAWFGGVPELETWETWAIVAHIPAIIFGVPAYLLLRRWVALKPWWCAIVGSVIASILPAAMVWPDLIQAYPIFAVSAGAGAFGGFIFWFVAAFRLPG